MRRNTEVWYDEMPICSEVFVSCLEEKNLTLGTSPEELATHLAIPHFMRIQYEFGSVAEILELEFTKMLEANVRSANASAAGNTS